MLVRDAIPATTNSDKYFRPKSTVTLSSSKSEQSIPSTPHLSRGTSATTSISNLKTKNRIILIVSGHRYETFECTLSVFPDTLLGDPVRRKDHYDPSSNALRFFRHPGCFDAILFYYQSRGILSRPHDVPRDVFQKELEFFGISAAFDKRHQFELDLIKEKDIDPPMPRQYLRKTLWALFEYPHSSSFASVLGIFSTAMILISVLSLCAETVPAFKRTKSEEKINVTVGNETNMIKLTSLGFDHWYTIEAICIVWFTFEYLIRLCTAPNILKFIFSGLGLVDLVSITPFYVTFAIRQRHTGRNIASTFGVIRIMRLLRILRVFKLTRYNEGLRILLTTIYQSSVHLKSILLVILIMAVFFATIVYYVESFGSSGTKQAFTSIPDTFWYSIITMTTVGYGDVYPRTPGGKFFGAFCGIFGVLLFCLPSPVLVNKFIECYYLRQVMSDNESPERKKFVESMKEIYFKGN